jgi:transposase
VVEVNTPHPHTRARKGKDDVIDAEAAARKVLAGEATTRPKTTTGAVESTRVPRAARESPMTARTEALSQLQGLPVTAPRRCASRTAACRTCASWSATS